MICLGLRQREPFEEVDAGAEVPTVVDVGREEGRIEVVNFVDDGDEIGEVDEDRGLGVGGGVEVEDMVVLRDVVKRTEVGSVPTVIVESTVVDRDVADGGWEREDGMGMAVVASGRGLSKEPVI